MIDEVQFGEFAEWILLPLGTPPEVLTAHLLDRFSGDPTPEPTKRAIAERLPVLSDQVQESVSGDGTQAFAVWILVPTGGTELTVVGCAFAALVRRDPGAGPSDFIETLVEGLQLYQPIDVSELETPIGTAHLVRARTYDERDHGLTISQTTSVVWLPEGESFAIWLGTVPSDDLVEAADVASALEQFAASITVTRS
ncbi:hypothetical protein [Aeromicrobium sp. CF3.5]|uniref:hypothetical protein n=1 Tax=Aeromicrobium sp. CF3.5 TaxID=3373078 RepID=UPI003EE6C450